MATVSIHARLATGDSSAIGLLSNIQGFQFTPALRRATWGRSCGQSQCPGFNSRPPCDGRPVVAGQKERVLVFQFTPALRRAT